MLEEINGARIARRRWPKSRRRSDRAHYRVDPKAVADAIVRRMNQLPQGRSALQQDDAREPDSRWRSNGAEA